MKKSNKNNTQLSQRDLELIDFLWKWKVCTTLGLSTKFFSGSSVWAYNRLLQLSKVGLVRCVAIDSTCKRFVWTLDQKGFYQATKDRFQLKEVGFASEAPEHDLFVTAMHLGDWLNSTPVGVELFSEQELRRKFESHYPNWVPKMAGRRPDGYWFIPDNKSGAVFALEVELSVKDQKEYGPIGQSYRDSEKIGRIFWVIESVSRAELLHQKFLDVAPEKYKRHDFILTPDFNKLGWEAPIVLGADQGKTFLYALCKGQESLIEASLKLKGNFNAASIVDARKCPFKSTVSRINNPTGFLNRMAIPPYSTHTNNTAIESSSLTSTFKPNKLSLTMEENNHE